MRKPITFEEAEKRLFDAHGDKIKLIYYKTTHELSEFSCNVCGYTWKTTIHSVWIGHGCHRCNGCNAAKKTRFSFEYIKEYIESEGCCLLSLEYVNSGEPIEIKFSCGHIGFTVFDSFKQGHRCDICAHEENRLNLRRTPEEIQNILIKNDFKFISFVNEYKNGNSRVQYKCKYGHFSECSVNSLVFNTSCRACSFINMGINRQGSKSSNWQGGLTRFTRYVHGQIIEWKRESMKANNYLCAISGEKFTDVHHLVSLNLIIKEAMNTLELSRYKTSGDYPEDILFSLIEEIKRLHKKYPLGVCLTRKIHKLFHDMYGKFNNTPEQFEEFKTRIASGEIQI